MAFVMAASIDDAGWVVGNGKLTDFLVMAALGGVVAGFVGSKVGWNRWLAHGLGAVFAALIVPILVGQVLAPGAVDRLPVPGHCRGGVHGVGVT